MFILALYPGAGETYVSHVFNRLLDLDIRTLESLKIDGVVDLAEAEGKIIKTTALPEALPIELFEKYKIVYLVRDGRDCILNNAYYRKNILDATSVLDKNIEESILAEEGSFFGGWSTHVESWISRADYIFKFEDFIQDPIGTMKSISEKMEVDLSSQDFIIPYDRLILGDHKNADHVSNHTHMLAPEHWQKELSDFHKELFLKLHADTLLKLGYISDAEFSLNDIVYMFPDLYLKMGKQTGELSAVNHNILFEASKLQMNYNDGVKRYVIELLKSIKEIVKYNSRFSVDVFDGAQILNIKELDLDYFLNKEHSNESIVYKIKMGILSFIKEVMIFIFPDKYYNAIGLFYKSTKAKVLQGELFGFIQKVLIGIQENVFKNKIQFIKPSLKIDMSSYDLVHIPLLQDVDYINEANGKALVTLHDLTHLTHPHFHNKDNIILADMGLKLCVKTNAIFLAISENTKQDLVTYNSKYKDVEVVYEAADHHIFYPIKSSYWSQNIRAVLGIPSQARYFLSLSTLEPRKNLKNAILAFHKALPELPDDVYFVIAGKKGWMMKDVLPQGVELSKRIIFTGFVKEEQLPWLYREAVALVYISHYEGFGLPLLESMSCGRPVVFGDNSSMVEIVGGTGYPVDSTNVTAIKNQLLKVINDPELLTLKSLSSLKRSNDFSWQKTGLKTLSIYEKCTDKNQVVLVPLKEKNVSI